ncbi:MAG: CmcI family methyltransferase [bacterium]|nr:CmcI family methyltransferase [bacterium]
MNEQRFQEITSRLERLDAAFRETGISDEYKKKWGVDHNVGFWMIGRKTAEWISQLIRTQQPAHIVELGTSVGYSTLWMAKAAESYGGNILTIEKEPYKAKEAREYFEAVEAANVELIEAEIESALVGIARPIDLLFLDANKSQYHVYLKLAEPLLRSGSIIVADNMLDYPDKVAKFDAYVRASGKYEGIEILDMDHGVLVARRK